MLFQKHLLKTMLEVEETFFALARSNTELGQNTIILCDRGAMDPSACTHFFSLFLHFCSH